MERITIRISEDEKELLQAYCDENDVTMSFILRKIIKRFLNTIIDEE